MKHFKKLPVAVMIAATFFAFSTHAQNSGTWNPGMGNDVGIETVNPDGQLEIVSPIDCNQNGSPDFPGSSTSAYRTNAFVITRQWTCPPIEWAPGPNAPVLKPLMWVRTNYEWNAGSAPSYATHLFLDKDGNFGLGTASPWTKFHLKNGSGLVENGSFEVRNTSAGNYGYALSVTATNALTKALAVGNGTNDLFLVWGNGVVNTKKIYAEELQVISSAIGISWPDYVFDSKYKLMPLTELEKYLKENNHLPEVPSTCDVQQNGVNVGEFNSVLLKKVEELTLYMIGLQKENDALNLRLKALECK